MYLHYYKKFSEKDMQLEVIVECPDNGEKTGTVVDVIVHPLDYVPKGNIIYEKEEAT